MDYVITVNDNGELKTVTAAEIRVIARLTDRDIEVVANRILDARSAAEEREEINRASAGVL